LSNKQSNDPFGALRVKDFRNFQLSRGLFTTGLLMQSTIIGWQVYELTGDKLSLGLIGLSEAIPFILTTFYSGYVADMYNRSKIIANGTLVIAFISLLLLFLSLNPSTLLKSGAYPIYLLIVVIGVSRAFLAPATSAYHARLIPRNLYSNGSAWGSMTWNLAAVIGPVCIGYIYQKTDVVVAYSVVVFVLFLSYWVMRFLPTFPSSNDVKENRFFSNFLEGLKFVKSNEPIKLSFTLDLFVVLFGSVTALLPAFAKDILHVEQAGLGMLKSAQFFGSFVATLFLLRYSPVHHAGRNLLIAVFGFALCMIGFGFSTYFWLSMSLLVLSGMFDSVSVVIRATILQLFTPDTMRGRVSAVSSIFIKSSNEIGDFESGLAARFFGLQKAVLFGGVVSLSIVLLVTAFSKRMRNLKVGDE
jgi:MFS family permease